MLNIFLQNETGISVYYHYGNALTQLSALVSDPSILPCRVSSGPGQRCPRGPLLPAHRRCYNQKRVTGVNRIRAILVVFLR